MSGQIYFNGTFVSKDKAKISLFERGFLYGDGLFETMRVYSGSVFRLTRHLERLWQSAEKIRLKISLSRKAVEQAIDELIRKNALKEACIRLSIWRREGVRGIAGSSSCRFGIALWGERFISYSESAYNKGFRAVVASTRHNQYSPLAGIKSMNYLNNILARIEAEEKGANEGILLNGRGFLAEGTASNLFLVDKGVLLTPDLETGILPGITREAVLELALGLGLKRVERKVRLPELLNSEEAFLTNSLIEVMPLVIINNKAIGSGKPGSITKLLRKEYRKLVKKETTLIRRKDA